VWRRRSKVGCDYLADFWVRSNSFIKTWVCFSVSAFNFLNRSLADVDVVAKFLVRISFVN